MVVSTEYYDLLGVAPEANEDEIRRGVFCMLCMPPGRLATCYAD